MGYDDIHVVAKNDVWLAGESASGRPFAAHWDGAAWKTSRLPLPTPDGGSVDPYIAAVDGRSSSDLWGVGHTAQGKPALLMHWNGRRWTTFKDPYRSRENGNNVYWDVAVTPEGHAWAIGHHAGNGVVLHWNGVVWKVSRTSFPADTWLYGIGASSNTDAWGVGQGRQGPFVGRWNGRTWQEVRSAYLKGERLVQLRAVSATSPHDVWAVGATAVSSGRALVKHWNGARWGTTVLDTRTDAMLTGVKALSASDVWAVGSTDGTDRSLIAHYSC